MDAVTLAAANATAGKKYLPLNGPKPSGDTTGATDTAAINAAITTNPVVVLQGDYYTNGAILMPSNRTLILMDAAIHLAAGSNDNLIRNSGATAGTAQTGIHIQGIGRAVLDGNGSNQVRQTKLWKNHGILLLNVTGFRIEGLQVGPTNAYAHYIASCSKGAIRNIRLNQDGLTPNQDGMDIIWACSDISVDNVTGTVNDDGIGIGNWDPTNLANELPYISGDMSDIRVSNVRINSPYRAVRIINGNGHVINKVHLSGIHNVNSSALDLILFGPSTLPSVKPTAAQCKNISITDISGRASGRLINIDQSISALRVSGVVSEGGSGTLVGNQLTSDSAIQDVAIRDVVIQGGVTNLVKFTAAASVNRFAVEGVVADTVTKGLSNGTFLNNCSLRNWNIGTVNTCLSDSTTAEAGYIDGVQVAAGAPRWLGVAPKLRFGSSMPTLTSADTTPDVTTNGSVVNCDATKVLDSGPAVQGAYRSNGATWVRLSSSPMFGLASQVWYSSAVSSLTALATTANRCTALPILLTKPATFDTIAVNVTAAGGAGSTIRLGIYADNGSGAPGALILDAGTVASDSIGQKTAAITQTLGPGLYWLVARDVQVTSAPTITVTASNVVSGLGGLSMFSAGFSGRSGWFNDTVASPLPATFPTLTAASNMASQAYFVMLRAQ